MCYVTAQTYSTNNAVARRLVDAPYFATDAAVPHCTRPRICERGLVLAGSVVCETVMAPRARLQCLHGAHRSAHVSIAHVTISTALTTTSSNNAFTVMPLGTKDAFCLVVLLIRCKSGIERLLRSSMLAAYVDPTQSGASFSVPSHPISSDCRSVLNFSATPSGSDLSTC